MLSIYGELRQTHTHPREKAGRVGGGSASRVVSRQIQLRLYVRGINLIRHYKIMTRAEPPR